jgi:hypothetical protein
MTGEACHRGASPALRRDGQCLATHSLSIWMFSSLPPTWSPTPMKEDERNTGK